MLYKETKYLIIYVVWCDVLLSISLLSLSLPSSFYFCFFLSQYQSWIYLLCGLLIYGLERLLRLVRSFYSVVVIKVRKTVLP